MRYFEITQALTEKRRNPHLNPKRSTLDQLRDYAGQKDVFVSFTHDVGGMSHGNQDSEDRDRSGIRASGRHHNARGAKIGIYPGSEYETPLGIYTYPIDHVLNSAGLVEFAGGRPYVFVVRVRDMSRILDIDTYGQADLVRDLKALVEHEHASKGLFQKAIRRAKADTPAAKLWNVTRMMAASLTGADDWDEYDDPDDDQPDDEANPFNGTDEPDGSIKPYNTSLKTATQWAKILRGIGYDGAVDYSGSGLIHENEPTQGVFFVKTALEVIDVIHNREESEPMTQSRLWSEKPEILRRQIARGQVSSEQIIEFLEQSGQRIESVGWDNLPADVQSYINAHFMEFLSDKSSHVLKYVSLTDAQWIDLIGRHPKFASHISHISPNIAAYMVDHIGRFKSFIGKMHLSPGGMIAALSKSEDAYSFLPKEPSKIDPIVLKWMIDNRPYWFGYYSLRDTNLDPAIYEYYYVSNVLNGPLEFTFNNKLYDWAKFKMWDVFVRCFNRLDADHASRLLANNMDWLSKLPPEVISHISARPAVKAAFDRKSA